MTALRRKAETRGYSMGTLSLPSRCDVCGLPKAFGENTYKHTKCAKIRQERYARESS